MADAFEYNSYLIFSIHNNNFAFNVKSIDEVLISGEIVLLPVKAEFTKGLINYRDQYIPVLELAEKFQISTDYNTSSRYIVVNILKNEVNQKVAVEVDSVKGVTEIRVIDIKPVPDINKDSKKYLEGLFKFNGYDVTILNPNVLISDKEIEQLESIKK